MILTAVTVGTHNNVGQPWDWHFSDFPVNISLGRYVPGESVERDMSISGTISVQQGDQPALGVSYGVLVGLRSGGVWFRGALGPVHDLFVAHLINQPGAYDGRIEYRYLPKSFFKPLNGQRA